MADFDDFAPAVLDKLTEIGGGEVPEPSTMLLLATGLVGLAGLRIGYGFASEEIVDYINRVRQPFNANTLAQVAARAALEDSEFVARTLKIVREGLSNLYKGLDDMDLEYVPTHTNFFLIKVPGGGKNVYEEMLRRGVIVRSMDSYGLEDYIRINVGLPQENERFVKTLREVLGR